MLWITPIAECSIFNSMQPKFYEVMLATRQTAHLINLGLSINSLINCYHSRAWKIHQQVHGSPWKWDSLPHSSAVFCRRLPSPRLAAVKFMMLGVLIWLWRVSSPHWFLVVLLQFCFLFLDFPHKWTHGSQEYQGKPCLNPGMVVTCPFIMVPLGGLRDQHLHCLPLCLIFKSLSIDKTSI